MTKEKLEKLLLAGWIVPIALAMFFLPALTQYYVSRVGSEFLASINAMEQIVELVIIGLCLIPKIIPVFVRSHLAMSIICILMHLIVAVMGSEQIELRFYINSIGDTLTSVIAMQGIHTYMYHVWSGNDMRDLQNKIRIMSAIAGISGSFAATLFISKFSIDELLWFNAGFQFIFCSFNHYVFLKLRKHVIDEKGSDVI